MSTFHDNKLWQDAYVSALDVAEVLESVGPSDVATHIKNHSLTVLTVTADALTRRDRREMEGKLRDVGGLVAAIRSLLSVAWAQDLLSDEQFGKLDGAYENLSKSLK